MTSRILDRIFNEVCLDDRIPDGIFQMEETAHMDSLRDYFIKRGITKEAAIHITNRMTEGRFPERQGYRKEDNILVTWPTAAHRNKAMQENPGKYTLQPPPSAPEPAEPAQPAKKEPPTNEPPGKEVPDEEEGDEEGDEGAPPKSSSNLFGGDETEPSTIQQGDKRLQIEPALGQGDQIPTPPPPVQPVAPITPQRISAEKEVVKQIMATDDTSLANILPPMTENCRYQLNELYKKADQLGYKDAITFLTPFMKS